ncbi:MAG TPA: DUF4058 family protein [Anaerolineae bacterium]|nr:DUF4058 family protein [Anaerolineae bacterium]
MPTPFPGMDPYLERPGVWEDIHTPLILEIANLLEPRIQPLFRVAVERRAYQTMLWEPETPAAEPETLLAPRDAAPGGVKPRACELPLPQQVIEHFLEIRDVISGEAVTIIEVLSLDNKLTPEGRQEYERQRRAVLGGPANLVEIDLLRAGDPFPMRVEGQSVRSDYRIVVSRAPFRPHADVYLFGVRDAIPDIPIPVQRGKTEPMLPLNEILHNLYDRAGPDLVIDYRQPPDPPLSAEDAEWANPLLQRFRS